MRLRDFNGRTAFVVGGSIGIGLEAGRQLRERGANVAVFARNSERLSAAVEHIRQAGSATERRVESFQLDVTDRVAVASAFADATKTLGPPDLLLNCAGRAIPRPFKDVSYEQFDQTIRINLYGTWNTVSALVPAMRERGGYIVNTSSLAAVLPVFGYTDYCASKAGIVGFSEALRMELAPVGIGVSVLLPPDTDTPGLAAENRTKPPETQAVSALSNVVTPDVVVRGMFRGVARGRFLIIPTTGDRLFYLLKRMIPGIDHVVLDRVVRKTHRQSGTG